MKKSKSETKAEASEANSIAEEDTNLSKLTEQKTPTKRNDSKAETSIFDFLTKEELESLIVEEPSSFSKRTQNISPICSVKKTSQSSFKPNFQNTKPNQVISFQLISNEKAQVSFSLQPSKEIEEILEKNNYKRSEQKQFNGSYLTYSNLYSDLLTLANTNPSIVLQPIPIFTINLISAPEVLSVLKYKNENHKTQKIDYRTDEKKKFQIPPDIKAKMYKYQISGVEHIMNHNCRYILADEMGLGKTLEAIALCTAYIEEWPLMIICPSSLKLYWRDQIIKWVKPYMKNIESNIFVFNTTKDFQSQRHKLKERKVVYIISYKLSMKNIDTLSKSFSETGFIICDEAHYLKNRETKRAKTLIPFIQKIKRILLITGTPLLARPVEFYPLLKIIRPDLFQVFKNYGIRYCNPSHKLFGVDYFGHSNTKELNFIVNKFMIRRLKSEILNELPSKHRQKIEITGEGKYMNQIKLLIAKSHINQQKELKEMDMPTINQLSETIDESVPLNCFVKAYHLTGRCKINSIKEYVSYIISKECKCVFFAHHIFVLDAIEEEIKSSNKDYIRIDGSVNPNKRNELVEKYQYNDNYLYAILSITSCYEGINLSSASNVVFCELYYTHSIMIQCEDRCHRIGQKSDCVNVHYLYCRGTADDFLYQNFVNKSYVVNEVVGGEKVVKMTCRKSIGEVSLSKPVETSKRKRYTLDGFVSIKKNMNFHEGESAKKRNVKDMNPLVNDSEKKEDFVFSEEALEELFKDIEKP